ncbi:MAG: MBL fold metallo-hydrolase [Pseudonocardiales bacterium]|nr:MAG: MBL fold metallo-hydrolase [Pseudonocardiales bacterium]
MLLTKYTQSCVRLEGEDGVLVVDPGQWSEPEALAGAAAVLVTHEHVDHIDVGRVTAALAADPALTVYTNAAVAAQVGQPADRVVTVAPGEAFEAAGFSVQAVGGLHAEIYEGLPGCPNIGFVIDERLYHPGDALFVPDGDIETLLVPICAPWLKVAEALDFVRAVAPARAYPMHDAMLSDIGLFISDRWFGMKANTDYSRIGIRSSVTF